MGNTLNDMMMMAFIMMIVMAIVLLIAYIVAGIYLNKLSVILYGKKTPMAWIPIMNIYLLGKLTFNKVVGWILIIWMFLQSETSVTVNGVSKTSSILPENIRSISNRIFSIVCIGLIIYSIVKYYSLKNKESYESIENNIDNYDNQMVSQNVNQTVENLNISTNNIDNNILKSSNTNTIEERKNDNIKVVQKNELKDDTIDPSSWDFVQPIQNIGTTINNVPTEEIQILDDDDNNNISN